MHAAANNCAQEREQGNAARGRCNMPQTSEPKSGSATSSSVDQLSCYDEGWETHTFRIHFNRSRAARLVNGRQLDASTFQSSCQELGQTQQKLVSDVGILLAEFA
jgi:hypothetical protein